MNTFILALQFLTRIPTPQLKTFDPKWLSDSSIWFALVGGIVGGFLYVTGWLGSLIDPWLAALLVLFTWTFITGGLHLDGLADLADASGAAHSNPQRFHEVLKDPHMGSFGAIALIVLLISKLILVMLLFKHHTPLLALILVPAWARLFAVFWAAALPSKADGSGERFAWHRRLGGFFINTIILVVLSYIWIPMLLLAPLICLCWWAYLKYRIGGQTGDCLGAGIEICECLLLLTALLQPIITKPQFLY